MRWSLFPARPHPNRGWRSRSRASRSVIAARESEIRLPSELIAAMHWPMEKQMLPIEARIRESSSWMSCAVLCVTSFTNVSSSATGVNTAGSAHVGTGGSAS